MLAGMGRPGGFLRWMREAALGQVLLVRLRAVGRVRPDTTPGVRPRDEVRQLRPVVAGGVRRRPGPDQPMAPVDADVVLVPERWHREIHTGRAISCGLRL